MPDDWRIRECANQLLLFAAFDARGAMLSGQGVSFAAPPPLPPFDDVPNIRNVRVVRDRIAVNPLDVDLLVQLVKSIRGLPDNPKSLERVREQPPWMIGDAVTWWLQAGVMLAGWIWERTLFRRDATADPQQAIEGLPPEDWLFNMLVQNLSLEDDEEHPAFWFVDHAEAWRLTPDAASWPAGWNEPATSRDVCLEALLEWCGDPRREAVAAVDRAADPDTVGRWARDYEDRYRNFARASLRLLRRRCRFGDIGELSTRREQWRVCAGSASPRRPLVLRRPIQAADDPAGRALAPGWIVLPWPAVLVKRLRRGLESMPEVPLAIARALDRAQVWGPDDRGFRPVLPARGGDQGSPDPRTEAERLVALASLAVVLAVVAPRATGERKCTDPASLAIEDRILWTWAVEGIELRRAPRESGTRRVVPLDLHPGQNGSGDGVVLSLACDEFPRDIVVGRIGKPGRSPDELFAAVEELDWRWWAIATLRDTGRLPTHLESLARLADEIGWERHKQGLLEAHLPPDRGSLVDAHAALHRCRLHIERDFVGEGRAGIVTWLTDGISTVAGAVCRLLATADPTGVARVVPPRNASGEIVLSAWMAVPGGDRSHDSAWGLAWEASPLPFGQPLREALGHDGRPRAVFSAGEQVAEADLRLLAAPGVVTGSAVPEVDAFAWPLRVHLLDALGAASNPDPTSAIVELRESCSGPNAEIFDRMIHAAIAGVPAAVAWVRLMQADPRFGFSCHPAVEVTDAGVRVHPVRIGDPIEWQDHDTLADGEDVMIRFATDAVRSARTVSRGRPAAESADAHAARLVAAVADGPAALVAATARLRLATDRRRMFGTATESAVDEAVAVGDALAAWAAGAADGALEAFRCLASWCAASGLTIVPRDWHPVDGADPAGLGVERVDFHPRVPAGRVAVMRFGLATSGGAEVAGLQGCISAGPPPAGYADLRDLVAGLPGDIEAVSKFRASVFDFPRRVRSGQVETSVAGLFDVAWKAVMKAPEREDLREAAASVHRLLDRSYGLITFEPKTVGEYPETWLQTGDGGRPRGLRVDRLLRPGLRTIDNKLKWPAIVETR